MWPTGNPPVASTGAAHHETSTLASPTIAMAVRHVAPGHDAEVIGTEPCVIIDWMGMVNYARWR